jgi:hypothetical protein
MTRKRGLSHLGYGGRREDIGYFPRCAVDEALPEGTSGCLAVLWRRQCNFQLFCGQRLRGDQKNLGTTLRNGHYLGVLPS